MDDFDRYDVICLGTGFVECILGGLFSTEGKRVLFVDRERFCGGSNGSVCTLSELEEKFPGQKSYTSDDEFAFDLVPKRFIGRDRMVQMLEYIGVDISHLTRRIQANYIYTEGQFMPVTLDYVQFLPEGEQVKALVDFAKSCRSLNGTATYGCMKIDCNESVLTLLQIFKIKSEKSKTFALHGLSGGGPINQIESSGQLIDRIKRFCDGPRHQPTSCHYPNYGLGEMTQQILKCVQKRGARYMPNRPVSNIQKKRGGYVYLCARDLKAKAQVIVGDPSYFPELVKVQGQVMRGIAVLNQPVPNTSKSKSCTIVVPRNDCDSNIIINVFGEHHSVAPKNKFLAYISTAVKADSSENEINAGFNLCGQALAKFSYVANICKQVDNEDERQIFVSNSFDASADWESVCDDVIRLYQRITGRAFTFASTPL